jgi:hypothetical protein
MGLTVAVKVSAEKAGGFVGEESSSTAVGAGEIVTDPMNVPAVT